MASRLKRTLSLCYELSARRRHGSRRSACYRYCGNVMWGRRDERLTAIEFRPAFALAGAATGQERVILKPVLFAYSHILMLACALPLS